MSRGKQLNPLANGAKPCARCGQPAYRLCDWPTARVQKIGKLKRTVMGTCDVAICLDQACCVSVDKKDYCRGHVLTRRA